MLAVLSFGLCVATGFSHYRHPYAQTQHLSSAQEGMAGSCQQFRTELSLLLATSCGMLPGCREENEEAGDSSNFQQRLEWQCSCCWGVGQRVARSPPDPVPQMHVGVSATDGPLGGDSETHLHYCAWEGCNITGHR